MKKYLIFILFLFLQSCGSKTDEVDLSYRKEVFANYINNNANTIKIALVLPITGKYSKVGQSALQSAMMSLASIHNNYISLVVFDTEGKPDRARSIALQLEKNNIKMMIGPILPESVKAVASVAHKVRMPIITYTENRDVILGKKNMYSFGLVYDLEVERLVKFMTQHKGSKKFAILHPDNDYGDALYVAFINAVKRNKGVIVSDVRYKPNKNDYKKEIQALIGWESFSNYVDDKIAAEKKKPEDGSVREEPIKEKIVKPEVDFDTLFIADYDKNLYLIASHLPIYDLDKTDVKIMGTSYWDSTNVKREYALRESYIPFYPEIDEFVKRYRGYYKEPPVSFAAEVADSIKMVSSLVYYNVAAKTVVYNFSRGSILRYNSRTSLRGIARMNKSRIVLREIGVLHSSRGGDEIVSPPDINYVKHDIDYEAPRAVQKRDITVIEQKKVKRDAELTAQAQKNNKKDQTSAKKDQIDNKQVEDTKDVVNVNEEDIYSKPEEEKDASAEETEDKKDDENQEVLQTKPEEVKETSTKKPKNKKW